MLKYVFILSQLFVMNFALANSWDSCYVNLNNTDGFEINYEVDHNSNTELSEFGTTVWSNKRSGGHPIIRDAAASNGDDIKIVYSKALKRFTATRNNSHVITASSSLYETDNSWVQFWLHHGDDLECRSIKPRPPFPTVPQTCDVFKGPAQRWSSNEKIKLHLKDGTQITNTTIDGKIGFFNGDESNKDFKDDTSNGGCDGLRCAVDESLAATIVPNFIDIDNDGYENVAVTSGSALDGTTLNSNYYHEVVIESGTLELQGEYVIETLKIGKDHRSGSAILKVGSHTKLHVKNIEVEHNGKIEHQGRAEDFWIIVHGDEAHFHSDDTYQFNALILANTEVKLHKNVTLNGGVTSQKIDLHDSAVLNGAVPNDCLPEQPGLKDVPYEFGSIEGMDCTHGCNLLFQKQYDDPVVFLMSTINPDDIVNSVPTKASVATIWDSKKGATIESESAESYSSTDRMSPIYYFVTEPGRLTFYDHNGAKVYGEAGNIITSKAQCKGNACGSSDWETVSYQGGDIANPVIMAQVQGKDRDWATTAISGLTNQKFKLALERGRQGPTSSAKKIAYLAVPTFYGKDESKSSKIEFYQAPGTYNQKIEIEPDKSIGWSCLNNEISLHQNFDKFGVIANKQTRNGGDGGWLRYCKQYVSAGSSQFTFAFDEDAPSLSTRKHGAYESVGYFAFEIPEVEIPVNVCNLFPEPIQSWTGVSSELTVTNNSVRFLGWSDDYISRYLNTKSDDYPFYDDSPSLRHAMQQYLMLGFDHANYDTLDKIYNNPICEGQYGCDLGNNDSLNNLRKVDGANVVSVPTQTPSDSLILNAGNDDIALSCGAGSSLCSYQESGRNVEVTIEKNLASLTLNKWGTDYNVVRVKLKDGIYISNLDISNGNDVELVIPKLASVTFGSFKYSSGSTQFIFESGSQLNVIDEIRFSNRVEISSEDAYPIIYAPDAKVIFEGSNSIFKGFILADYIELNQSSVEGAVTARTTQFNSNVTINKPDYSCPLPPIPTGSLVVTPKHSHVLTCEVAEVEFKVVDDDGNVISTVQDNFTASHAPNFTGKWCEDKNGNSCSTASGDYQSHFVNGQRTLYLSSSKLESYDVSGTWNGELETAASKINFVPYKFDVNEQFVVAGEGYDVTAKVSSCNTQDSSLSQDYVGTPTVNLGIVQPANGNGAISLLDYAPDFELSDQGETTDTLSIQESGQFKVTLTDNSFDCSEISGCPESGVDKLSGSFLVNSRPWKFAICTINNSDGNSSSGSAFAAAGEEFDVFAKPIRFMSDASQQCNNSLVTQNYLLSAGAVGATHTLDTPSNSGAVLGSLEPTSQLTQSSSDIVLADNGYKFKNLEYSEVGSFNFEVTEDSNSFYGKILGGFSGSKSIGRFYPKFFLQENPEWNVANQNDIAYLSQPYDSTVHQVYPMASGESGVGNALNNYQFFASSLQAHFGVLEDTAVDNQFLLHTDAGSWSTDRKHWLLNDSAAVLERVTDSDSVSRKDNPFNTSDANSTVTHFGLTVDGADPVSFTDSDTLTGSVEFLVQPPARYGRMALDDIGGNSDTVLTIPLRAEFWDGSEFVVNEDDNRSTFDGSKACKQVIWHSDGAITTLASLNGSGSADDGEEEVTANQNTPAGTDTPREQVRLWLRMGDSKPSKKTGENDISCSTDYEDQPWLQYNWRQLGDEDPSTVVTFGIYRGNDRVIYRGESGLTGQ
ncbi:MSHA biogenesis protein MshQ [Vibrio chagasii]|nr:MSHA biogenesis protein MshQ [Vibrio chagasii]